MIDLEMENPVLAINIALSGNMPTEENKKLSVRKKMKRVLDNTVKHISRFANVRFGFMDDIIKIRFITSRDMVDSDFIDIAKSLYSEAEFQYVRSEDFTLESKKVNEEAAVKKEVNYSLDYSWITDQIDFAIILTDNQAYDDFLHHCKLNGIPAAVINTEMNSHIMWTEKSEYDSYDDNRFMEYLTALFPKEESLLLSSTANREIYGRKLLWGKLYPKYMKKHKAIKDTSKPYTEDTMMEMDVTLSNRVSESVRNYLLKWFYGFDSVAVEYSEKYHSSIYLRAILPLIVTVALAVGFYVEPLFGPWKIVIPGTGLKVWSIIAGFGFFTHAFLNFYAFRLSENDTVKSWHKGFIDNRFIAESLRVAIHFMSYGVPVNYLTNITKYGTKIKRDSDIISRFRGIIRGISLPDEEDTKREINECLNSLEELINDQIEYHTMSVNRYVNICNSLKTYGKIVFYIGFVFVLFRGFLQFALSFLYIPVQILSIIKPFTNMLALLFPAWAGYFSLKLSFCNFEGLYNNDMTMLEGLKEIKQIIDDKKKKDKVAYSDIYELSKQINSLMLFEVSEWYAQVHTRKITSL